MIKNIFSKIRFNNISNTYYRHCCNSFTLGYSIGCFYANKKIEANFDYLQFQYIDTSTFIEIREKFFSLLKTSGLRDDGSGVVFSFLSMNLLVSTLGAAGLSSLIPLGHTPNLSR